MEIYDGKRETLFSRAYSYQNPNGDRKKRISELFEKQQERLEELWFSGLIDGEDYRNYRSLDDV